MSFISPLIGGVEPRPIYGPMTYAQALAAGHRGPFRLDNGLVVAMDPNTSQLVPEYLLGSTWTRLTSIDQATYVAGSPPSGWAESGTVTVGGTPQYIDIAGASGGNSSLTYTIASLGASDFIAVLLTGYGASIAGSTNNYSAIRIRRNSKYLFTTLERGATSGFFMLSSLTGSPAQDPISSVATIYGIYANPTTAGSVNHVCELSGKRVCSYTDDWAASTSDLVELFSISSGGGGGSGHLYVDHCSIYQGTFT